MRVKTVFIFLLFFFAGCVMRITNDVDFARTCLKRLIKGNYYKVAKMIEWPSFFALKVDVGKTYRSLPDDKERVKYIKKFIKSFSWGFKQAEGKFNYFINWRIRSSDSDKTVVAADHKITNNTLLFTIIHRKGERKLVRLEWEK
jgi:hypothetical protein